MCSTATKQKIRYYSAKIHTALPATIGTQQRFQRLVTSAPSKIQCAVMSSLFIYKTLPVATLAVRGLCCHRRQRTENSKHPQSKGGTSFLCKIL